MNKFNAIVIMNEAMIQTLKDKNYNYEKNAKIQEYLQDEAIFFKLDKAMAFEILKNVGVRKEALEDVYSSLTEPNIFYDLLNRGKIKENDENIVIKYRTYNSNDLFKKNN